MFVVEQETIAIKTITAMSNNVFFMFTDYKTKKSAMQLEELGAHKFHRLHEAHEFHGLHGFHEFHEAHELHEQQRILGKGASDYCL